MSDNAWHDPSEPQHPPPTPQASSTILHSPFISASPPQQPGSDPQYNLTTWAYSAAAPIYPQTRPASAPWLHLREQPSLMSQSAPPPPPMATQAYPFYEPQSYGMPPRQPPLMFQSASPSLPMAATRTYPQSSTLNAPPPKTATSSTKRRRMPTIASWESKVAIAGRIGADDPAFGPNFTFMDILTLRLPEVRDVSRIDHTAPCSNRYPSPTPPCFYLRDDGLLPSLISTLKELLERRCKVHDRPLGNCNTPLNARAAWMFLRQHVDCAPYTNEGWVATYTTHINSILSELCYYINETACVTTASIQGFSQCGEQIEMRVIREETPNRPPISWPVSGFGVGWKTARVFEHHRHELRDFMVIGDAGVESMEGIMKNVCQPSGIPSMPYLYQMGLHMNTVHCHMRSEVEELCLSTQRSYPGPSQPTNRFGAVFTGSNFVMLEAVTGTLRNGTIVPGLAYTVASVAAHNPPGDPSYSIIALMLAALYDVGARSTIEDLSPAAQETWENYKWQLEQQPQPSQSVGHSSGSGGGSGPPSSSGGGSRRGAGGSSKGKSSGSGGRSGRSGSNQYSRQNQAQLIDLKFDVEGFDTPARPLLCYSTDSCIGGTTYARSLDTDERIVLELDSRGARKGSHASTFRGTVHSRDHSDIQIFFKTYPKSLFDTLDQELRA
ncbi:hypothetical protein K438DRAFT_285224 [Mycena galopus ATCC 62051]|nr:hypothetical protein K438DRAFT_285224 [Mycena galopus ATCC 62051]